MGKKISQISKDLLCCFIWYAFCCQAVQCSAKHEQTVEIEEILTKELYEYLTDISADGRLNAWLILSQAQYYDDGTLKQLDQLEFAPKTKSSQTETAGLLQLLESDAIKNFTEDINKMGFTATMLQERISLDGELEREVENLVTAERENGTYEYLTCEELITKRMFDILNLADEEAVVELTELYQNGNAKQTWQAKMTSKVVTVKKVSKMPYRMVKESKKLLQEAYKQVMSTKLRSELIARLFDETFTDYDWEVLSNSGTWSVKSDVHISLSIENDEYTIFGTKH